MSLSSLNAQVMLCNEIWIRICWYGGLELKCWAEGNFSLPCLFQGKYVITDMSWNYTELASTNVRGVDDLIAENCPEGHQCGLSLAQIASQVCQYVTVCPYNTILNTHRFAPVVSTSNFPIPQAQIPTCWINIPWLLMLGRTLSHQAMQREKLKQPMQRRQACESGWSILQRERKKHDVEISWNLFASSFSIF